MRAVALGKDRLGYIRLGCEVVFSNAVVPTLSAFFGKKFQASFYHIWALLGNSRKLYERWLQAVKYTL